MAVPSLVILAIIVTIMSIADFLGMFHRDSSQQQIALGNTTAPTLILAGTPERGVMVSFFSAQSIPFIGTFRRCGLLALGHVFAAVLDCAGFLSSSWPFVLRPSFILRVAIKATWTLLLELGRNLYLAQHYAERANVEDRMEPRLVLKGAVDELGGYLPTERIFDCLSAVAPMLMLGVALFLVVRVPFFGLRPDGLTVISLWVVVIVSAFACMAVKTYRNVGDSGSKRNASSDGVYLKKEGDISKGSGAGAEKVAPPAAATVSNRANRKKHGNKKKKRGTVW